MGQISTQEALEQLMLLAHEVDEAEKGTGQDRKAPTKPESLLRVLSRN
jgi:hypothetical protein